MNNDANPAPTTSDLPTDAELNAAIKRGIASGAWVVVDDALLARMAEMAGRIETATDYVEEAHVRTM